MGDSEPDSVWTKPKQSFKLKKTLSRGRPGAAVGNRTLPDFSSQPVKRRNPFGLDDSGPGGGGDGAKRQKLGDIFSPSSMFRERKTSFSKLGEDCITGDSRGMASNVLNSVMIFFRLRFVRVISRKRVQHFQISTIYVKGGDTSLHLLLLHAPPGLDPEVQGQVHLPLLPRLDPAPLHCGGG
jgi:hypothetical protein